MVRTIVLTALFMLLTVGEAATQRTVHKLVVTNSSAWPPFSFLNENAEPRGLLVDLWKEFGRRNQIDIEFRLVDWEESLALVRNGDADVHAGLFESGKRQQYLDFSDKVDLPLTFRLFVSNKMNVNSFEDLGTIAVGLTEKSFAQEFIATKYPSLHVFSYVNEREVVAAAVRGDIVAFVLDLPAAMYYLHKFGDPGDFHAVDILFTKELKVAVKEGNIELLFMISEGFDRIPKEDIDRITHKWIHSVETTPEWLFEYLVGGGVGLVVLFIIIHIIGLRQQVKQRTRELEKLSQTDMLTGLYNRLKTDDIMEQEAYRAKRYNVPLSLIVLDIDYFKRINDNFGHTTGDSVLVAFAGVLLDNVRRSDSVGRWGGEEFLIICPETNVESATALAEKLRLVIASHEFDTINNCTSSFGVTEVLPEDDVNKAFERADMALYKSKADGRNRVTVAD